MAPMSSTGTTTSTSSGLRMPASMMVTGPAAAVGTVAAQEVGDLLQRPLGGAEADALRRALGDCLQPLEAEHQVGAALGGGHRVDLVDDDRVHVDQRAAHLAGEHQVQALGRGDEQVDRAPRQRLTILRRLVSPVRMATVGSTNGTPSRSAASRMPISGERRFFSTSNASARSGEMYEHLRARLGVDRSPSAGRDQPVDG